MMDLITYIKLKAIKYCNRIRMVWCILPTKHINHHARCKEVAFIIAVILNTTETRSENALGKMQDKSVVLYVIYSKILLSCKSIINLPKLALYFFQDKNKLIKFERIHIQSALSSVIRLERAWKEVCFNAIRKYGVKASDPARNNLISTDFTDTCNVEQETSLFLLKFDTH